MKKTARFTMIAAALTLILSGFAAAQDKPKTAAVDLKILPAAVLNAFKAAYPKAVIIGASKETENGVTLYEVESVDGTINRDLLYTADGKATEIEESTAPENLPVPVKQTLAKEYPGAKVLKAEILTKDGAKLFELSLQVKDKPVSVTIDPQGKIEKTPGAELKAEEKEAEENEKDEEKEEKEDAAKPKVAAVDLKILPAAVLNAFKAAYPKAVIKGASKETENGVTLYEVESVDGTINRDLLYTADGKATEIEESTAPENLPVPVKQTVAKEYPGAKILKAEILTKGGAKLFELSLQVREKSVSVTIDPRGKIVK
jgi:uncharacterized membrane protein YkoI